VAKRSATEIQVGRGSLLLQISVDLDCRHYKVEKNGVELATVVAMEGCKSEAERDKIQWQVTVLEDVVTEKDLSWEDFAWMDSDPVAVSLKFVSFAQKLSL
jgi:hypothetical protein